MNFKRLKPYLALNQMRNIPCFLLLLLPPLILWSQPPTQGNDSIAKFYAELNDGPYVFIENGALIEKNIIKGTIVENTLEPNALDTIYRPEEVIFTNVDQIAALSDIHGQYNLTVQLLQQNEIIDDRLKWNFGKGHLVINGDIFDRGDKVNELLWLFYDLEKQAKKAGGRLHYLLGNHEFMILHNDVRYVHRKYRLTGFLLRMNYYELYGKNTVMGRWLRSKPTIIKINDLLFVHAGISEAFLDRNAFDIEQINAEMRNSIDISVPDLKATGFYSNYYGSDGPIWYRGYFDDTLTEDTISNILERVDSKHIVVGHSSNSEVVQLFDKRIFGVDSGIQFGENGELLMINDSKAYRKTLKGRKKRFRKTWKSID